MWRRRFDTLGKLTHDLSDSLNATAAGIPTVQGHFIMPLIGLWDSPAVRGHTHRPWTVGAPARWAGVNFPKSINLADVELGLIRTCGNQNDPCHSLLTNSLTHAMTPV